MMHEKRLIFLFLLGFGVVFYGREKGYLSFNSSLIIISLFVLCFFLNNKKYIESFLIYLATLLVIFLVRPVDEQSINLSFEEIRKWLPHIFKNKTVFINIIGNIILYIPFGLYLPKKCKITLTFLFALIFIITVEFLQLLLSVGIFDIGDIILNLLGVGVGCFGYLIWRWI